MKKCWLVRYTTGFRAYEATAYTLEEYTQLLGALRAKGFRVLSNNYQAT